MNSKKLSPASRRAGGANVDTSSIHLNRFISKGFTPSFVYEYCNADGLASGAVARFEAGMLGDSKQFRQYRYEAGGFQVGLNGQALPLYNLPAIVHEDEKLIVWVEGEKCVEVLRGVNVLATTTPGGSGGFNAWLKKLPNALDVFAGREVVLMADNDEPGAAYVADVGEALADAGAIVRVVDPLPWADIGEKADVADWLAVDGNAEKLPDVLANAQDFTTPVDIESDALEPLTAPPLDALPGLLPEYVESVAEAYCVDPAMPFAMLLAVASSAIGRAADIQIRDSWREIAPLWIGVIAPAGAKKSPVLKEVTHPMFEHTREMVLIHKEAISAWEAECKAAKKAESSPPERPRCSQSIVSDTTIEALALVLEESPRVLSCQDELKGLFDSMGCYKAKGGHDRQSWLSLHNGGQITINRKSQRDGEPLIVESPRLGIVGCTTPASAARLVQDEAGDGLIDRFFFVQAVPVRQIWNVPDVSEAARKDWYRRVDNLCRLPVTEDVPVIPLTEDAGVVFGQWYEAIDTQNAPGFMQGVVSKLAGHCGRVALTLALLTDPTAEYVEAHDIECAIRIVEWMLAATFRARQAMFTDHETGVVLSDKAANVKGWLERHSKAGTISEIIAGCKSVANKEDALAACNELQINSLGDWLTRKASSGRSVEVFKLD